MYRKLLLLCTVLFPFIANGCNGEEIFYTHPLFVMNPQQKILQTQGQFRAGYSFDYNADEHHDLFLLGKDDIFVFLGTPDGVEDTARWQWHIHSGIRSFDVTRCFGKDDPWIVVLTDKKIVLFENSEDTLGTIVGTIDTNAYFLPYGRLSMFQQINEDSVPDLVIPFCSGTQVDWYAQIYIYHDTGFQYKGTICLKEKGYVFPPRIYIIENSAILAEGKGVLRIYRASDEICFPTMPSEEVVIDTFWDGEEYLSLLGLSHLNANQTIDLVFGKYDYPQIWVWLDHLQIQALTVSGILNLAVEFRDCNRDNWNDIVCITLNNTSWIEILFSYICTKKIPIFFTIHIFLNQQGVFQSTPSHIENKIFWISPQNSPNEDHLKMIEDIDNDGLADGMCLDRTGKLSYFYNIFQSVPEKKPPDWFDYILEPAYCRIAMKYWPIRLPDVTTYLPNPDKYRVQPIFLPSYGKDTRIVFHYKAMASEHDLIVVIFDEEIHQVKSWND